MVDPKPREEINKLKGHLDQDGFYILDDGSFYDPQGYYFDKNGFDALGGRYDEQGIYVKGLTVPQRLCADGKTYQKPKQNYQNGGKLDADNFYILPDGSFYDPFGFYFNAEGFDEAGGKYDNDGYYLSPFDLELDIDDIYGDEDDLEADEMTALERQAVIQEHVVMAQHWARQQLKQGKTISIRIDGVPSTLNTKDKVENMLRKKIDGLQLGVVLVTHQQATNEVAVYVQSTDVRSVIGLLGLHLQRCQLSVLKTWALGYPDYIEWEGQDQSTLVSELKMLDQAANAKKKPVVIYEDEYEISFKK